MTWLGLNRWWLIAVAVLLPATLVASLWPRWFEYMVEIHAPVAHAAPGELTEYAGSQWRVDEWMIVPASSVEGGEFDLPTGTQLVAALMTIEPGEPSPLCSAMLVDDARGRTWRTSLDAWPEFRSAPDAEMGCDDEVTGPYQAVFSWIVPADVGDSGVIELTVLDAAPLVLRFDP